MRVVGYVRVSTDEQASGGVSLKAQTDKVRAYSGLYGLDLVEVIADPGQSGKSLNRPGLKRALAMLASGGVEGLVIAKLDRLTRSVADLAELLTSHFDEPPGGSSSRSPTRSTPARPRGDLSSTCSCRSPNGERETIVERHQGRPEA